MGAVALLKCAGRRMVKKLEQYGNITVVKRIPFPTSLYISAECGSIFEGQVVGTCTHSKQKGEVGQTLLGFALEKT